MEQDIRDIKGPGALPFEMEGWMWLLGVFLLLAVALILFFKLKKKRETIKILAPVVLSAAEKALQALDRLVEKAYPSLGKFKEYFFELSMILRRYLEEEFEIPVTEKTSEEFLFDMAQSDCLNSSQKKTVQLFLQQSDLIKFAKQETSVRECREAEGRVRGFIKKISSDEK